MIIRLHAITADGPAGSYDHFLVYELVPDHHPSDKQLVEALKKELPPRVPGQMEIGKTYIDDSWGSSVGIAIKTAN